MSRSLVLLGGARHRKLPDLGPLEEPDSSCLEGRAGGWLCLAKYLAEEDVARVVHNLNLTKSRAPNGGLVRTWELRASLPRSSSFSL